MRKSSHTSKEFYRGQHRAEHWYRDNSIYFITARCHEGFAPFQWAEARSVFWDRHDHYTKLHTFTPIVTSLLNNHYHEMGYLKIGDELGELMRKLHGSVAKLVNDVLEVNVGARRVPYWGEGRDRYFDGCLRDELQYRRTYRYVLLQAVRAGLVKDWRDYPDTRVRVELEAGLKRAFELGAFMEEVPYKRYQRWRERKGR